MHAINEGGANHQGVSGVQALFLDQYGDGKIS
jgi:hypothetical protein